MQAFLLNIYFVSFSLSAPQTNSVLLRHSPSSDTFVVFKHNVTGNDSINAVT